VEGDDAGSGVEDGDGANLSSNWKKVSRI
jgi:hypothetical protein